MRWQSSLMDEVDRSSSESVDDADILSPPAQAHSATKPPQLASKGKTPASASGAHKQPVASKPASVGKGKQQVYVTSDSSDDDADVLSHKSSGSSSGSGSASSAASSSSGESDVESVGAAADDAEHLHAPVALQVEAEVDSSRVREPSSPMFGASSDSDATTRRRHASDGLPQESPSPRKLTYRDLQRDLSMSDKSSDLASPPPPAHTMSLAPVSMKPSPLNPPRRYTSIEQVDIHRDTAPNGEVIAKLLSLRQQLARLTDGNALHAIVKAIIESGRGSVSHTTFDFDLCQLDLDTLRFIQKHLRDVEQRTSTS